jgi:hypothetical protein
VFHPPAIISDFWNVERHYEELFADHPDQDELGDGEPESEAAKKGESGSSSSSSTASDSDSSIPSTSNSKTAGTRKESAEPDKSAAAHKPKGFRPLHLEHSPISMIGLAIHRQVTHQLEVQMRLGEMFTRNPFSAGRQRKRKKRNERRKQNDGSESDESKSGSKSGSKGGESGSKS